MNRYIGDFAAGATVRIEFNTNTLAGAPVTLTSGAVTISKNGTDVTPSGGVTLSTDAGSVTGRHTVAINTATDATAFTTAADYSVRLSGSSAVSGQSVVGTVLGTFSIANRSVAPQTGDAYARIGAAGAGLTALGPVTLAAAQASYAPAKAGDAMTLTAPYDAAKTAASATALASLVSTVGAAGAGLTALGPVALASSQPNYAPATAASLATLAATVGAAGAGLTAIPDSGGTATLLTRLSSARSGYLDNLSAGAVALASQVPANFTAATFASAGVFSTGALINAPTGGGGGGTVQLDASQPYYAPAKASDLASLATSSEVAAVGSDVDALAATVGSAGAGLTAIGPVALTTSERSTLAAAILDLTDGVESGETVRQTLRLLRAVLAGQAAESSGTYTLKRKDGTTTALTVVHDVDGNRTSSTVGTL